MTGFWLLTTYQLVTVPQLIVVQESLQQKLEVDKSLEAIHLKIVLVSQTLALFDMLPGHVAPRKEVTL